MSSAPNGSSISKTWGSLTSARNYGEALLHATRELIGVKIAEIPETNEAKIML
jgi:hypothetical protein